MSVQSESDTQRRRLFAFSGRTNLGKPHDTVIETNQAGRVKFFHPTVTDGDGNSSKNFGFIIRDGVTCTRIGEHAECTLRRCNVASLFVHGHDVDRDSRPLQDGDNVVFDIVKGPRGLRATGVVRVPPV